METQILLSQCRDEVCELKAKVALLEKALDGAISEGKLAAKLFDCREKYTELGLYLSANVAGDFIEHLREKDLDIYIKLEGLE